jgi:predicted transcriptional regulator
MSRGYPEIAGDAVLQELLNSHLLSRGRRSVVVKGGDDVLGLLTLRSLNEVPREKWPTTTVAQAMIPMAQVKWVRPDMDLEAALTEMDRDGVNQLPVMANGRMVGMLTRGDLVSFLRRLQPRDGGFRTPSR